MPVFSTPLVAMKPLTLLSQPIERSLSTVFLEAALLEAALEAPSAPGYEGDPVSSKAAPARTTR
jgi:hypothetical protein